jgi:hypothetical protein
MPIQSPRRLYLISQITVNQDDVENLIDLLPGTTRPIVAKIKEAIGDYMGLTALKYNDPIFNGTFAGNGTNKGAKFRKTLGGFKDASYTLIAKDQFAINEFIKNPISGAITRKVKNFNSMTIGFPKGHSVTEVIKWLETTNKISEIRSLISPQGYRTDLFTGA